MYELINKHIDVLEKIESETEADINKFMGQINIDAVLEDPQAALMIIADAINERMKSEYAPKALVEGLKFAKAVKDKTIEVPKTKDPNLNA